MIQELLLLLLIGVVAGFLSGLIGIGGGLFYIIVYSIYLRQYEFASPNDMVNMVVANSIFSTFFAGLAASVRQIKLNNFYWRPTLLIGISGLLAAIIITITITEQAFYNEKIFLIIFTIAVIPLIWKMIRKPPDVSRNIDEEQNHRLSFVGILSGMGSALSGLGGAFIIIPMLNGVFKIDMKKVVSVAVGAVMIVSGGLSIFNLLHQSYSVDAEYIFGGIHLVMVLPVVLAILVSAPFGVQIAQKINAKYIRYLFLLFCFAIIIRNCIELIQS